MTSEREDATQGVRQLTAPDGGPVETGAVRFGDDWVGLFLCGNDAFRFALHMGRLVSHLQGLLEADHITPDEMLVVLAVLELKNLRQTILENVVQR